MPVADTSWLVALMNAEDAHHVDAVAAARALPEVVVPDAIMAETMQVITHQLARGEGRAKARKVTRQALRDLLSLSPVSIVGSSVSMIEEATKVFEDHRALSMFDALAVSHALADGLLSFDRDQLKAHERRRLP